MANIYYARKGGGYATATGREPKGTRYYRLTSTGYGNLSEKYARSLLSGKPSSTRKSAKKTAPTPKVVKGVARGIPTVKGAARASSRTAFGNFVRSNGVRYGSNGPKGSVSLAARKGGKNGSRKSGG